MNIQQISDNLLCSGCGTCNSVCGHNAIKMKKTATMGLLYATVDTDKCTNCGLCLKMCPSLNILEEKKNITSNKIVGFTKACYIGRSLNKTIFDNAQSGGLVTTILKYLFDHGLIDAAVSCRMDYGVSRPNVHYSIISSVDELKSNQKSCYTQVDVVSALRETASFKSIAVVGVPCHIQGLSNLQQLKKYVNVKYKIGLICDKTYSDSYMDAIMYGENKLHGQIKINYRQKNFTYNGIHHSYQQAPTVIENERGEIVVIPNRKRMFLKDYFSVPKCAICWDKLNVQADIVCGDPWGLNGQYDKIKGDSLIIVRSNLAETIINEMKKINLISLVPVSLNEVICGQSVEKRISLIKDFDWQNGIELWKTKESRNRQDILKQVEEDYLKSKHKSLIFRVKRYLKKMINKV